MKKILIKDLVIPAGTVFRDAPIKTERYGGRCVEALIGLTANTSGNITYWFDDDPDEMAKWFRDAPPTAPVPGNIAHPEPLPTAPDFRDIKKGNEIMEEISIKFERELETIAKTVEERKSTTARAIEHFEKGMRGAAKYYMEEVLKDNLKGALREWFANELRYRGMSDLVELLHLKCRHITIGDTTYRMTYFNTPTYEVGAESMRCDAKELIEEMAVVIQDYVRKLPADAILVDVPALHVSLRSGLVKWFIWGYLGTPVANADDILHNKRRKSQ